MTRLHNHLCIVLATTVLAGNAHAAQYLVEGSGGPGFTSPQHEQTVLERGILPTFEILMQLEKNNAIKAGGLPVGERAVTFIIEAKDNAEVDRTLRKLPAWGVLNWKVTPLESFSGRSTTETARVNELKKAGK